MLIWIYATNTTIKVDEGIGWSYFHNLMYMYMYDK